MIEFKALYKEGGGNQFSATDGAASIAKFSLVFFRRFGETMLRV